MKLVSAVKKFFETRLVAIMLAGDLMVDISIVIFFANLINHQPITRALGLMVIGLFLLISPIVIGDANRN